MFSAKSLKRQIKRLRQSMDTVRNYEQYRTDPVGYIRNVLKKELWSKQIEICEKLLVYPYKVLVKSSHKTGKCGHYKDLICIGKNQWIESRNLVGKTFQIPTIANGEALLVDAKADWNGIEPIYELHTVQGKDVRRTGNHPLWTITGWEEIQNIKPGDKIACPLDILGDCNSPSDPDTFLAPKGMYWDTVRNIRILPTAPTVAIEVPEYHTYITQFYEHNTFLSACLTSWFYDCFNPSLCITTAPSKEAVDDQLWREIRIVRDENNLGGFSGPQISELKDSHGHWAKGLTTAKSESFHGRHQEYMLFIIDEAVGVKPWVFDVIKSQFKPEGKHYWIIIGNPTNTASPMYIEEFARDINGDPAWHIVEMSTLDHPNIAAGLAGEELPFPAAVSLDQFYTWLSDWCEPITAEQANATDLEFPPNSGKWYRPFPDMESRALGRWPSSSINGVWSDSSWQAAMRPMEVNPIYKPEIGCDIALEGDDYTAFHVRCGGVSLYHYRVNGWQGPQIVGKCKELCHEWAEWWNARRERGTAPLDPKHVRVKLDDTGTGGGIAAFNDGYNFIGVNAAEVAWREDRYPNKRSELWFVTANMARKGEISFAGIKDQKLINKIRAQAMAPIWKLDNHGRRVLEKKAETKKRLKISPDDMDAINLAYYGVPDFAAPHGEIEVIQSTRPDDRSRAPNVFTGGDGGGRLMRRKGGGNG